MMKGVYTTRKKDNSISYRVSITLYGKHISLGSYNNEETAGKVYLDGRNIIDYMLTPEDYQNELAIPHEKYIVLSNYVINRIYVPTPIFLRKQYFEYYLSDTHILKFDRDDLFFYSSHKIQQKGGYLFVSDYGSQYKILSRYGIRPFAVYGRDYIMVNNDKNDYRYSNIKIINNYTGVRQKKQKEKNIYETFIHINGNYLVGRYDDEISAAIAYNKAVDILHKNGMSKAYIKNYILSYKKEDYISHYEKLSVSAKLYDIKGQP
ncbi:MAG: hypothetical protein K2G45_11975 [Lachnospiraceae bacterium]|nr:hypothetical protein [Lachnospiraceae bacterium]